MGDKNLMPLFQFSPRSRGLSDVLFMADDRFFAYENHIAVLESDLHRTKALYNDLLQKQLEDGKKLMADVLKACINKPSLDVLNAASAIIILKIEEMQTIEDVHEFIFNMKQATLEKQKEEANLIEQAIL